MAAPSPRPPGALGSHSLATHHIHRRPTHSHASAQDASLGTTNGAFQCQRWPLQGPSQHTEASLDQTTTSIRGQTIAVYTGPRAALRTAPTRRVCATEQRAQHCHGGDHWFVGDAARRYLADGMDPNYPSPRPPKGGYGAASGETYPETVANATPDPSLCDDLRTRTHSVQRAACVAHPDAFADHAATRHRPLNSAALLWPRAASWATSEPRKSHEAFEFVVLSAPGPLRGVGAGLWPRTDCMKLAPSPFPSLRALVASPTAAGGPAHQWLVVLTSGTSNKLPSY